MALRSLGRITIVTSGTPVRATFNETDPTARYPVHIMLFQRNVVSETGLVYILENEDGDATGTGVVHILSAPIIDRPLPLFKIGISYASVGLNLQNYYIDADNDGEGCIVSALRA